MTIPYEQLPDWAKAYVLPLILILAVLAVWTAWNTNRKMSLEQQEIKLRIEEARKKAAEARRTGETRELGELVEGLVAPIGRSEEASFLLMRFLFLSILLALAYAVQGVVISVGFGIAEGVDILGGSFNQELLYVVAQLVQIIAQVVVALVAFVFGVPLFVDVQKFLRER